MPLDAIYAPDPDDSRPRFPDNPGPEDHAKMKIEDGPFFQVRENMAAFRKDDVVSASEFCPGAQFDRLLRQGKLVEAPPDLVARYREQLKGLPPRPTPIPADPFRDATGKVVEKVADGEKVAETKVEAPAEVANATQKVEPGSGGFNQPPKGK